MLLERRGDKMRAFGNVRLRLGVETQLNSGESHVVRAFRA